jgi:hypothetical protein
VGGFFLSNLHAASRAAKTLRLKKKARVPTRDRIGVHRRASAATHESKRDKSRR